MRRIGLHVHAAHGALQAALPPLIAAAAASTAAQSLLGATGRLFLARAHVSLAARHGLVEPRPGEEMGDRARGDRGKRLPARSGSAQTPRQGIKSVGIHRSLLQEMAAIGSFAIGRSPGLRATVVSALAFPELGAEERTVTSAH